jgi:hypothetical protein
VQEVGQAFRINLAFRDGSFQGTTGFFTMPTVVEAALPEKRLEVDESLLQLAE